MTLLDICKAIQYSEPLTALRSSPWFFPIIAVIHLMGLAMIGGSVLVVDMRLLGFGLRRQPVMLIAKDAERWLVRGLFVSLPTGLLLFMCFATKYYYLAFFWVKMAALASVLLLTFSVRRRVTLTDESHVNPAWSKAVALVSLSLWTTVAIGGRWIGFP